MLNPKPFLFSVGIHTALLSLFFGGLSVIHKKAPPIDEKISLKILLQPTAPEQTHPTQPPPQAAPTPPLAVTKPISSKAITPPKIQPAVETTAPTPTPKVVAQIPQPATVVITKAPITKAPISEPTVVKAPIVQPNEQPPKHQKEEYVYTHSAKVQEILNQRKIFPKNARKLDQYGEVLVRFDFTPNGEATNIRIIKSSGFDMLDNAAKELIKTSSSLFPKPQETVPINVPIEYMRP